MDASDQFAIATIATDELDVLREFFPTQASVAAELGVPMVAIDNASQDGSAEFFREWAERVELITVRSEQRLGYAANVNRAFAAVRGRDVFLLNPDVRLASSADVSTLRNFLAREPRAGVVAPRLTEADGSTQASARPFPSLLAMAGHSSGLRRLPVARRAADRYVRAPSGSDARRVDWVIGAAMLIRRATFDEVGGFDERFFLYLEDTDFCLRCGRAGWDTWYLPAVALQHVYPRSSDDSHGSLYVSPERRHHIRSTLRFFARYPRLTFRVP